VVEQLGRDAFFPDKETALLMLLHRYDANGPDGEGRRHLQAEAPARG
jgi:hypothetical protein